MYINLYNKNKYPYKLDFKYKIVRDMLYKERTNFNLLSNILFKFLVCTTFFLEKPLYQLKDAAEEIFANGQEYIGDYCYRKIGRQLNLIRVLRKMSYFRNMMKKEPCKEYYQYEKQLKRFCTTSVTFIKYTGRPINSKFIYTAYLRDF